MLSRNTRQKEIIAHELQHLQSFFSAEQLHTRVKRHHISLATVYRSLKQLTKEKVVYSYVCDKRQIYSLGKKSHCHFTCEKTGKIIHFDVTSLDFLKNKIPGSITSFQIEVRGVCENCSH
jgi:Fe2+ or Zn2+ uptake regulation protein